MTDDIDLSPEAVERLARNLGVGTATTALAGATLRALSARLAEVESLARGQDEQLEIQGNALIAMNRRATEQSARATLSELKGEKG